MHLGGRHGRVLRGLTARLAAAAAGIALAPACAGAPHVQGTWEATCVGPTITWTLDPTPLEVFEETRLLDGLGEWALAEGTGTAAWHVGADSADWTDQYVRLGQCVDSVGCEEVDVPYLPGDAHLIVATDRNVQQVDFTLVGPLGDEDVLTAPCWANYPGGAWEEGEGTLTRVD